MNAIYCVLCVCVLSALCALSAATPSYTAFTANADISFTTDTEKRGTYKGKMTVYQTSAYAARKLTVYQRGSTTLEAFSDIVWNDITSTPQPASYLYRVCGSSCSASDLLSGTSTPYTVEKYDGTTNTKNYIYGAASIAGGVPIKVTMTVPVANTVIDLSGHSDPIYKYKSEFVPSSCPPRVCELKLDLMFVLDVSGSMNTYLGSKTRFTLAKSFISQIANGFGISSTATYAGITTFGQRATLVQDLTGVASTFNAKLSALTAPEGWTCPDCGIYKAASSIGTYHRTSVPVVMIVITDGEPNCICASSPSCGSCNSASTSTSITKISDARAYAKGLYPNIVILAIGTTSGGSQVTSALNAMAYNGGISGLTTVYSPNELTDAVVLDLKNKLSVNLCNSFTASAYPTCQSNSGISYGLCCPSTTNFCPNCQENTDKCKPLAPCDALSKYGCAYTTTVCKQLDACHTATPTCVSATGACDYGTEKTCTGNPCDRPYCDKTNYATPCQTKPVDCSYGNTNYCLANWVCNNNGASYTCSNTNVCSTCLAKNPPPNCFVFSKFKDLQTCEIEYVAKPLPVLADKCIIVSCNAQTNEIEYTQKKCSGKCEQCNPANGVCVRSSTKDQSGKTCPVQTCYNNDCDDNTGMCTYTYKCNSAKFCSVDSCDTTSQACAAAVDRNCFVPDDLKGCYGAECSEEKGGCYYTSDGSTLNSCGMCADESACPKTIPASTIAAIAGGVVAAIIIAIVVFLIASSFATKKVYDAIKAGKESMTETANENKLYEMASAGGNNAMFQGNK